MPIERPRMRRLAPLAAALLAAAHGAGAIAGDAQGWQLASEQERVAVYTRPVADSEYLAVKATVRIDAPALQVAALMGDGSECMAWRDMCRSTRVLDAVSADERYVYMVLDLPWPLADRDLVIHSRTEHDPASDSATIHLNSASSRYPQQDYVRAETRGRFVIRKLDEHATEFTYIMHTELGGNAPVGMVNGRLTQTARDDLQRLRAMAEG